MRKKERAAIVIERLKKEYPGADCTLDYNEAWKLLVSVRLAAQCTDERVNIIVKDLFAKYPGVNELAEACLLYTSPSPRDRQKSRMPSSA